MKLLRITSVCCIGSVAIASHELDGRDLTNGQALYSEHCASCHGANLEGQPNWRTPNEDGILPAPPHDENGHTWHHDNRLLFEYTQFGGAEALSARGVTGFESGMPGFRDVLTEDDIWDVLGFIQAAWPKHVQDIQRTRNPPHE